MIRLLIVLGMIAIGVLVWKLLQRQESSSSERDNEGNNEQDRFGW